MKVARTTTYKYVPKTARAKMKLYIMYINYDFNEKMDKCILKFLLKPAQIDGRKKWVNAF